MSFLNLINQNAGRLNIDDNIIIDDAKEDKILPSFGETEESKPFIIACINYYSNFFFSN
jgi:hypothetical protein